ncbi:hypothetical protein [Nocardia niigatensis]
MGSPEKLRWKEFAGAATGVIGAVAVVAGTGLAVYSRWFASTTSANSEQLHRRTFFTTDSWGVDIATVPTLLATTAVCLGAGMLIAAGIAAVRITRNWTDYRGFGLWCGLAVVAAVVAWPALVFGDHVIEVWGRLRLEYPLSVQLPAALGAGTLIFVGAVLLVPILMAPNRSRPLPRRIVAVAPAAGVLLSAVTVSVAVHAGDDGLHVDHTTAARAAIPAQPTGLGAEKYRFAIPARETNSAWADIGDLVPVGTGFVLSSAEGITAYDGATGMQRWHYLRTHTKHSGNYGVLYVDGSLRSLDGGTVVLARWAALGWIAFDAVTGEILWQKSDFTRDTAPWTRRPYDPAQRPEVGVAGPWPAPVPLIISEDDSMQGYDPHTGARRWSTDVTVPGCGHRRVESVLTDTDIYRVSGCSSDTETWVDITVLDARTGVIRATREFARHASTGRYDPYVHLEALTNTVLIDWSSSDRIDGGTIMVRNPDQLATATPFDAQARQPIAADPAGPDVLISDFWTRDPRAPGHFVVLDTDTGAERYTLPGMDGWGRDPGHDLFLRDQIVETSYTTASAVQAWSRTDGHLLGSQPIASPGQDCANTPIRAVPAAIVVVCVSKTTAELIGYTQ